MNLVRGGSLTALAWLMAMGCGGSSGNENLAGGGPPPGPGGESTPDAGEQQQEPAPPPPVPGVPKEGIFLSASKGVDDQDGAVARPVKTLARAIALAVEKKTLPILACAETYTEQLKPTEGFALYGYYDCSAAEWKTSEARAKIVVAEGPALIAENVVGELRIGGFDLVGADQPTAPSAEAAKSAYGARVVRSTVTFEDGTINAGKAQDGADGAEPTQQNGFVKPAEANGGSADGTTQRTCLVPPNKFCDFTASDTVVTGGPGGVGECVVGGLTAKGGAGGGSRVASAGKFVVGIVPLFYDAGTSTSTASPGQPGAKGARGLFGANGSAVFGEIGFQPGDGTNGARGAAGDGGGGGNGTKNFGINYIQDPGGGPDIPTGEISPPASGIYRTGRGGGGGAGGCGGLSGTSGRGGGASIGLYVHEGKVVIARSTIAASAGGRGGKGAAGAVGTVGGLGGAVLAGAAYPGKAGGNGGTGGQGGQSGHGAPGPSVSIVYHGAKPTMTDVKLTFGSAGAAGPAVTDGAQSLPAPAQVAQGEYAY